MLKANDCYIKANYPPFFFELDLARTIDDAQSRTTCGEGYIRFELVKVGHREGIASVQSLNRA